MSRWTKIYLLLSLPIGLLVTAHITVHFIRGDPSFDETINGQLIVAFATTFLCETNALRDDLKNHGRRHHTNDLYL
jgi:hypothetical protein